MEDKPGTVESGRPRDARVDGARDAADPPGVGSAEAAAQQRLSPAAAQPHQSEAPRDDESAGRRGTQRSRPAARFTWLPAPIVADSFAVVVRCARTLEAGRVPA